jgi:hypothetical protein
MKRGGKIGNREIGQRSIVTGARSTLVKSETKISPARLPARPSFAGPCRKHGAEDAAPKPPGTLRIVSWEFD